MFEENKPKPLESLRIAANQHSKEKDYWLNQLSGDWVKARFPFDYNRDIPGISKSSTASSVKFALDEDLSKQLIRLSNGSDHRLYIILAAGLYVLLHKYTGYKDIIIGSPIYKQHTDLDLLNTVIPLRNKIKKDMTIKQLILEVRHSIIEGIENYSYPIELLPEQLKLPDTPDGFPLFDAAIILENIHYKSYIQYIPLNVIFSFLRDRDSLVGMVEYNSRYYGEQTVKRLINNLKSLLSIMIPDVNLEIRHLDILSKDEKNEILFRFNDTSVTYPQERTFYELFETQVELTPNRVAVVFEGDPLTYRELNKKSNQLARILRTKGVKADGIVAVMVERSLEMIIGIMGIMKAGGAYLPVAPDSPGTRVKFILEDSNTRLLLTQSHLKNKGYFKDEIIDINDRWIYEGEHDNLTPINKPTDMVYAIYTSGTTGNPKGVLVQHNHLINVAYAWRDKYHLNEMEINLLQMADFSFDVFAGDLARTLINGGKLVICPDDVRLDFPLLYSYIREYHITLFESIPSLIIPFMEYVHENELKIDNLQLLILGSDTCRIEDFKKLVSRCGKGIRIVNSYGVTETAIDTSYFDGNDEHISLETNVPIGKPFPNMKCYILDANKHPVPVGTVGELYIGGKGVTRGYLNNSELTRQRFLPDPFCPAQLVYKSGDLVRWLPDGNMAFIGRVDHQVKIRGFRIELEEIESKLLNHMQIKEAVVIARKTEIGDDSIDQEGDKYLCAYLVTKGKLDISKIKTYLLESLPGYMIPLQFVELEKLPLTPNGKIDRKALPEPGFMQGGITYITEKMLNTIAENSKHDLEEQDGFEQYIPFPGERERISYPTGKTIHELFEEQVKKTPDSIAVVRENSLGCVSYRELNETANRLAHALMEKGIKPGNIIGLLAEPSLEQIVGILAILKAGGAYLPLETENPDQRIKYFLEDCACTLLLTQRKFKGRVGNDVEVIYLGDDSLYKFNRKNLEIYRLHDPAYVAYTSGSTGKPKGVSITHENFCPLMQWGKDYLCAFANERVAQNNPYFFDWGVWEMFLTLTSSSSLHIVSPEILLDVEAYFDFININTITVLHTTPTHFEFFASLNRKLETLKYLLFGAEKLTYDLVERSYKLLNQDCRIFNMYGPTETTIIAATLEIDRLAHHQYKKLSSVPIGTAIGNADLLVLDKDFKVCPVYRSGELYIAGDSVAMGYLNDPEKTSNAFIKNMFAGKGVRGEYLYKTGDLVRWLPDANIEFLGRIDNQIKIGGFRIEPGEIESMLSQYKDINGAVTIVKEDKDRNKFICAFLVSDKKLIELHLREFLSNKLPLYMMPSYFVQLERIPMTRNGKVDRKALSEYEFGSPSTTPYMTEEMLKQSSVPGQKHIMALEIPGDKIFEEKAISEEEKKQVLYEFNQTAADYPKDMTIHQLFEEQVEKTPENIAVVFEDRQLSYYQLNKKSNQLARMLRTNGVKSGSIVSIMVERSLEMMIGILGILKAGSAYMPIDTEEPEERRIFILKGANSEVLLVNNNLEMPLYDVKVIDLDNEDTYNSEGSNLTMINGPTDLSYVLHTSGTTGKPKGVMIEHRSVVNFMQGMTNIIDFGERDRILSITTLSFDIFVLEAFIPLTTGSLMIVSNREQQLEPWATASVIERENITIFQTTPSVIRLLISDTESAKSLRSLKYLLIGGEAFPAAIREKLKKITNSKIVNLYGPTETTVWSTAKDVTGNKSLNIGKPIANTQIYILNKREVILPPGVAGELYIGGHGVARGYLNNPELTAEKFCLRRPGALFEKTAPGPHKNFLLRGSDKDHMQSCNHATIQLSSHHSPQYPITPTPHFPIYRTGDLAMWLPDGNIEFIARVDYQVKVGGIRIEPGEIENCLLTYASINEAAVVVKENENEEKYLLAYLVSAKRIDGGDLRVWISEKLPHYMIPALFVQLEKMPMTQNRKINRKFLTALEIEIDTSSYYIAPGNEIEEKLVEIWSAILNIPKETIGVTANFFELGGHSLRAITIIAKIHKAFNVKVPLIEMFKTPSVRGIAGYIKEAKKDRYESIAAVEKKDYYTLSSAQKRLYILQQMELESTAYNMPETISLAEEPDVKLFEKTFLQLIERHESLRTSFHIVNNHPIQKVNQEVEFAVDFFVLKDNTEAETRLPHSTDSTYSRGEILQHFDSAFDLSLAPLLKVGIVKADQDQYILAVVMHHIISDALSHEILVKDFMTIHKDRELPPLRIQYKDFSEWQNKEKQKEYIKQQERYWLRQFEGKIPELDLATDYPRPKVQLFEGSIFNDEISCNTNALRTIALENGATTFMVLLAIFNIFLSKVSGQEDIVLGTPVAGRRHTDLERIMGLFVNSLALRNRPKKEKTFMEFLKEVREKTLQAFENQEYQFEDLVEKLALKRDRHNPIFDVMFACQDQESDHVDDTDVTQRRTQEEPPKKITDNAANQSTHENKPGTSKFDLYLNIVIGKKLRFSFEYSTELFRKETIRAFARGLKEIVLSILKNKNIKLEDIKMTTTLLDTDLKSVQEELTALEF